MKKKILITIICSFAAVLILGTLEYFGFIWHNALFAQSYKIKGLDISHYQNTVEWDKVPKKYKFIFLKATEGKDYIDRTFEDNWIRAKENGFLVGAYHFFVTSCNGEEQANNFIATVPYEENSLPPVIDIEISVNKDKDKVRKNLTTMIELLTNKYEKEPILYVTYDTYNTFVKGHFEECDIWIRDIIKSPKLDDGRDWLFWQYSNRGRIKGIDTYVDINVFHGTEEELRRLSEGK